MWSLSNAFTSTFRELDSIPLCKATGNWALSGTDGGVLMAGGYRGYIKAQDTVVFGALALETGPLLNILRLLAG